ncbi:MAG: ABC transporter permease [Deltaproteobacteria bacterium]|nr:ABC transporter permease [Deltaproteobacteria bacterium]MBW2417343.1 ABC transporter permease [Deltaproteobacteria bacterium]
MPAADRQPDTITVRSSRDEQGRFVLDFNGRLDSNSTGRAWRQAMKALDDQRPNDLVIEAGGLDYCDGSGAALLVALRERQQASGGGFDLRGLRAEFASLIEMLEPSQTTPAAEVEAPIEPFVARVGRGALGFVSDLRTIVVYVGELSVFTGRALMRPRSLRVRDLFSIAEKAGIGAMPIVALVGFLLGLILSFQSAIPMRRFGAEVFVADLLAISLTRVLAGLMTAILLTARSGSAFAAEIGTMKVNEEIDALTTMGLEPVRFLVVPRVLAAVAVVPVLTMVNLFAGLLGGAVMFASLGFPMVTYLNRVAASVAVGDLAQGLFKSAIFGVVVAAVGCLQGLRAGSGAGAVGASATSAVVSGIVLIAVLEGIFSVIFYVLGI